jgi:hypothetical protein
MTNSGQFIVAVGHPSGLVGLGNVRNGHARPDEINFLSERW